MDIGQEIWELSVINKQAIKSTTPYKRLADESKRLQGEHFEESKQFDKIYRKLANMVRKKHKIEKRLERNVL